VPQPGFFEIYPSARPPLPAGTYTATAHLDLEAAPPKPATGAIPVDDAQFYVHLVSPRYVMPPDQILSTFPPAGSQGDWRERLPQIVLKRRTLPWERNPDPAHDDPQKAPPWLALVVLAEGEGQLSADVDVSQCVTPGVDLGTDADAPRGKYLEVTADVVKKVFPCLDELDLLAHVRKVDLSDTELALGDDDGYLAVVLSSRLPQPGPPATPGGDPTPLKYTAYLVNLEEQLDALLPTEPQPSPFFNATAAFELVDTTLLAAAPEVPLDTVAMNLRTSEVVGPLHAAGAAAQATQALAPFSTASGTEVAPAAWSTGPVKTHATVADDLSPARNWKLGIGEAIGVVPILQTYRFPVLVSWDFVCTGDGGFERLMNKLEVGLLGTLAPDQPLPLPDVAPTGHVNLAHRSRRGDETTSWYRGPLTPQPTVRSGPVNGVLPLAHAADQLRKVVPDGTEDISLAAAFEIGRLLTYSKAGVVAALMAWRRELFGAARAQTLSDFLAGSVVSGIGTAIAGGRSPLENLLRTQIVMPIAQTAPDAFAPRAGAAAARVPSELVDLAGSAVLTGLGASAGQVAAATSAGGVDGLRTIAVPVASAPEVPASQDPGALAGLRAALGDRVTQLTVDALNLTGPTPTPPAPPGPPVPPVVPLPPVQIPPVVRPPVPVPPVVRPPVPPVPPVVRPPVSRGARGPRRQGDGLDELIERAEQPEGGRSE
jgi:hypothetical protein